MCSEYTTVRDPKLIEEVLGVPVMNNAEAFDWGKTAKFFTEAPVIERTGDDQYELIPRTFPTSPMPNARLSSLEGQSDASTDDPDVDTVQIERIYEKRTWKEGFAKYPVLVPMEQFTEFAYWGTEIGTAQGFKNPGEDAFFAAGIRINTYAPKGPPYSGFSLITHTANEQMLLYHHRLIVILPKQFALGYLDEMTDRERFEYLVRHRYTGEFNVTKVRNMAKGWEKRIDNQEAKLRRELKYREVLQANQLTA